MRCERYGRSRTYGVALTTVLATSIAPGIASAQTAVDASAQVMGAPRRNDPQVFTATVGASHWSGDFGAQRNSEISAAWLSARYRLNGLRLTASLPWMRIRSQGAVFTGVDASPLVVSANPVMSRSRRQGVGDLTLGAAYLLPEAIGGVDLDLVGKVKMPTGSQSRGVSTGKTDFAVGVEASRAWGAFTPTASVRYRAFGDAGDWRLRNGWAASIGGAYSLTRDVVIVASYDYAQAASDFVRDSHEVVAGVSAPLGGRLRATGFVSSGLSDGAADVAGGLSLTLGF